MHHHAVAISCRTVAEYRATFVYIYIYSQTCFSDHLAIKTTFVVSLETCTKGTCLQRHFLCFSWVVAIDRFDCIRIPFVFCTGTVLAAKDGLLEGSLPSLNVQLGHQEHQGADQWTPLRLHGGPSVDPWPEDKGHKGHADGAREGTVTETDGEGYSERGDR